MPTINLFMWGYQSHFQITAEGKAEDVFRALNPHFMPEVFLIGVLEDEREGRHPVCLEPEHPRLRVSAFNKIHELARSLRNVDPESRIFQSHPMAQQNQDRRLDMRSYRNAIVEILNRELAYADDKCFVSYPAKVEGYQVFVVLKLNKRLIDETYSLTKTVFNDRFEIRTSFTASVIREFLEGCRQSLYGPSPGTETIGPANVELFRLAGKDFMYTVSQAGGNFQGLHGLFDACNTISSLRYEGSEGLGKIVIAKRGHKNVRLLLELAEPIEIHDYRKVRKFLEVTDKNSVILCDAAYIYGLAELIGRYNPTEESIFEIEFLQHYKWDVKHEGHSLMTVSYMQPALPRDRLDKQLFDLDIVRIFTKIEKRDSEYLWELIEIAIQQQHGTMLVISDNAKTEAKRLAKQSFGLQATRLHKDLFRTITAIDGAVLLDRKGTCHAIGLILDGKASDNGDSSRGARYNSAVRYMDGVKKPTMIVIVSEDGMIDIIPKLRPQVRHSMITKAVDDFRGFAGGEFSRRGFYKFMNFFEKIAFYLNEEECDMINSLRKKLEVHPDATEGLYVTFPDLQPDPQMNDSFYLPE
ncbi:diadenylate cyclase [Mucilaginibacter pedocola]|nr:diadenylate cyclase [Mucilaginibacter pedocola]